jgi:hypothetical protein
MSMGGGGKPGYVPDPGQTPGVTTGVQGTQNAIGAFGAQPYYGMQAMGQGYGNMSQGFGSTGFDPQGATNAANNIWNSSGSMPGMANTIWQQGLDPQNSQRNAALQQADATAMAGLSGSGVANTPYGASVRGTTNANTNLAFDAYRNQQLQQAGASAGGLLGQYGQQQGLGAQIAGMAPQQQQALLSSLTQGGNAALAPYQQMINSYLGLGNLGSGIYGSQIQGYGSRLNAMAQHDQANAQGMGGMGQMAGMAAMMMMSDRRLKTDIEPVGKLDNGLTVYRYRYLNSLAFQIGLMADEVEKVCPKAVAEIGAFKAVNYELATQAKGEDR